MTHMPSAEGVLYIVATPLGNLADLSERAREMLASVDWIYAEDTRHSLSLLQHLGIHKPLRALHAHNEAGLEAAIIRELQQGRQMALISDAGTPLISDPGFGIVRAARDAGLTVTPIPGPCALITALMASGLPCDQFLFHGFLPAKSQARIHVLQDYVEAAYTQVFYEAPHRIIATVTDFITCFGTTRPAILARELTKRFESWIGQTLGDILIYLEQHPDEVRGEMVLIVGGLSLKASDAAAISSEVQRQYHILRAELPLKQAVKLTAQLCQISKNTLYDWALSQDENKEE